MNYIRNSVLFLGITLLLPGCVKDRYKLFKTGAEAELGKAIAHAMAFN